jgi:hypothetical protein
MIDKKNEEDYVVFFRKKYYFPKDSIIYTSENLGRMHEYAEWLKEHGLKAAPSGYPDNFKKKKVTKPKGRNPELEKRDKKIRSDFLSLHDGKGYKATTVYKMLAKKYKLSAETIKSYTGKARR